MAGWMIDNADPARVEVVERAKGLGITGTPDRASHALGPVELADGRTVQAHVIHAMDAVITDGAHVVLINRAHEPRVGMPALPGGMIDPAGGGVETAFQAAAREALEEAGIDLSGAPARLVGTRNMDRSHDVRIVQGDGLFEKYGVRDGDIFMVSTQAVRFDVPDLATRPLAAGDDAEPGSARLVHAIDITPGLMGIGDHYKMIREALALPAPVSPARGAAGPSL